MPDKAYVSHLSIKVEGTLVSEEIVSNLIEVVVDRSLHLPSLCTIRLYSPDMKWLEDETFREGKKIELFASEERLVKLFLGKITGLEPQLEQDMPTLVVRAYDLSHNFYRGRHRRSFHQVTNCDLARKLASEAGLRAGQIDSSTPVHEYVFQNNQTNAEFLLERARLIGYELWVEDEQLHFRKPAASGAPIELVWGDNLFSFRPRLSTAEQVNEVEVRGWDPKQKRAVVGMATRAEGAPQIGLLEAGSGAEIAERAWNEAKIAVVDQFVRSPAEAEALAQALLDETASAFVEAEGSSDAQPDILPGRQIQIGNVGERFNGTYYVTQVIHEWRVEPGMMTHFTVSGRRDRGIWSLLKEAKPKPIGLGMVIGIVTNNKDPEELGRVKVQFPWLSDNEESTWARLVSPMAGNGRGILFLPEVDDEVLVGFEHGDIHRPFILGALWNGRDKPPLKPSEAVGGDGLVNQRIIKSRSGHTITLDDTEGNEQITIIDKTGQNKLCLNSSDNSMQINVQGDLTIEAQGKISLKGEKGVEISTEAQLKLSGKQSTELNSSAQVHVKGATVNVDGTTMVKVKGGMIHLN